MMFGDGNAVSQLWSIGMKMSTAECFSSLCVAALLFFMEGVFRHSHGLLHGKTCVLSYGAKSLSWIKTSNLGLVTIKHRKVTYNLTDVSSPRTPYKSDRATAMVGQLSKLGFDLDFCFRFCESLSPVLASWYDSFGPPKHQARDTWSPQKKKNPVPLKFCSRFFVWWRCVMVQ